MKRIGVALSIVIAACAPTPDIPNDMDFVSINSWSLGTGFDNITLYANDWVRFEQQNLGAAFRPNPKEHWVLAESGTYHAARSLLETEMPNVADANQDTCAGDVSARITVSPPIAERTFVALGCTRTGYQALSVSLHALLPEG